MPLMSHAMTYTMWPTPTHTNIHKKIHMKTHKHTATRWHTTHTYTHNDIHLHSNYHPNLLTHTIINTHSISLRMFHYVSLCEILLVYIISFVFVLFVLLWAWSHIRNSLSQFIWYDDFFINFILSTSRFINIRIILSSQSSKSNMKTLCECFLYIKGFCR